MELGVSVRRRRQTSGTLPKEFGSQIRQPLAAAKLIHPNPMEVQSAGKSRAHPELPASITFRKDLERKLYESDFARAKPRS
jgi:hypothetical protein